MNDRIVLVEVKQVYGVERLYPVNELGSLFAKIGEKATISRQAIGLIKKLGFEVKIKANEVKL